MNQCTFDFGKTSIQERFEQFHRDNPQVYEKLVELARVALNRGFKKYSLDALFHRLRWHYTFEVVTEDDFKLNDHYTSRYARLIASREPDLADFFEVRELKAE